MVNVVFVPPHKKRTRTYKRIYASQLCFPLREQAWDEHRAQHKIIFIQVVYPHEPQTKKKMYSMHTTAWFLESLGNYTLYNHKTSGIKTLDSQSGFRPLWNRTFGNLTFCRCTISPTINVFLHVGRRLGAGKYFFLYIWPWYLPICFLKRMLSKSNFLKRKCVICTCSA
jgi:hypothetical protein